MHGKMWVPVGTQPVPHWCEAYTVAQYVTGSGGESSTLRAARIPAPSLLAIAHALESIRLHH